MGLVTSIGSKIINYGAKAINYGTRAVKVAPEVIFGKGADVFVSNAGKIARQAVKSDKSWVKSVIEGIKGGGKALEGSVAANAIAKGSLFQRAIGSLKSLPSTIATTTKAGVRAAQIKGTSSILGGVKGFFKGVGKKMPLLGNLMLIAFELPNVFKATKEEGIGQGAAEVVKAGGRLAGGALGSAVGSAICPGIGSLVGWVAGEWLASKVVGKSYTEQQEELAQKQQEALETLQTMGIDPSQLGGQPIQNPNQVAVNPQMNDPFVINPFIPYHNPYDMMNGNYYNSNMSNPYANDIMMQGLKFNTLG